MKCTCGNMLTTLSNGYTVCRECADRRDNLRIERDRYKRALEDISGRGMSMYANQVDAFVDCRNIARKALKVEGKYTYKPSCCESKGAKDACFNHRKPCEKCEGCFYYYIDRQPMTFADLTEGE